ncbi:hypothetical protein [Iamia sp.]|uniref:hypothetical protein n=1 Tax=Iamia sp. TaxID=2722710 RepID=UPI002C6252A9|nr:hypothetical protein [Iamia sp.]HXH56598.1 hypothetical protein [Iamia sp.]
MAINYMTYHRPDDTAKVAAIAASMAADGWIGSPVVVDGEQALTGAHRLAAAAVAEIEVETVELRDLFEEAGLDLDEVAATCDWDLADIVSQLPSSVKAEYGIDLH